MSQFSHPQALFLGGLTLSVHSAAFQTPPANSGKSNAILQDFHKRNDGVWERERGCRNVGIWRITCATMMTEQDENPMRHIFTIAAILTCLSVPAVCQYGPAPFQACAASAPEVFALSAEQAPSRPGTIVLRIHLRNISPKPQMAEARDPQYLFAARILDASGKPVALTKKGQQLYSPPKQNDVLVESSIGPHQLQPQEGMTFMWRVSDWFDVSKPGSYRIALKEEIGDPMVIVCSKPIAITVAPVTEPDK